MEWSSYKLKQESRIVLKNNYFIIYIMCIVLFLCGGIPQNIIKSKTNPILQIILNQINPVFSIIKNNNVILISVIIFFTFIIGNIIKIGIFKYLINNNSDFNSIISGFNDECYFNLVAVMGLRTISTAFFTCLFILPGIIKYYNYFMVPYILSDNPNLHFKDTFRLSEKMMEGHKLKLFFLQLSFLFWKLIFAFIFNKLGIPFIIALSVIWPYEQLTIMKLYLKLRELAIGKGITYHEALNLVNLDLYDNLKIKKNDRYNYETEEYYISETDYNKYNELNIR